MKNWVGILSVFVLLTVGVGGYWIWANHLGQVEPPQNVDNEYVSNAGLPLELTTEFDPTQNTPRFMVLGAIRGTNSVQLEYEFPKMQAGERVDSKLICEKGIRVRYLGQGKGSKVEPVRVIDMITPENMPILLAGLCQDKACQSIVGECELYMSGSGTK